MPERQQTMILLLAAALVLWGHGCATNRAAGFREGAGLPSLPLEPVTAGPIALKACRKWEYRLGSHLSHVSATPDGSRVLVSTSEEGRGGGGRPYSRGAAIAQARLRLLDGNGRLLWSVGLEQPAKAQALSRQAAAVCTYEGLLRVFDPKGRELWQREHLGRPAILPGSGRVLLLNDDDSEPQVAFVSYDLEGNLKAEVKLPDSAGRNEPLDLFVADDESFVAVSSTESKVYGFDPDGRRLWSGETDGGVLAAAGRSGPAFALYALTSRARKGGAQALAAFGLSDGKLVPRWSVGLDRKYEALRLLPRPDGGAAVFLYGNSHAGQAMAAYDAGSGAELWRRSYPIAANYSSLVFAMGPDAGHEPFATVALDEGAPAGFLRLMGIGAAGASLWDSRIEAADGIYSYALAASAAPALVVGRGDPEAAVVEYFRVSSACGR